MMRQKWFLWGGLALCVAAMSLTASATTDPNMITEIIRLNSTNPEPVVLNGGLEEGAQIFVDRTTFFYGDVGAFHGLDYIQTAMDDKTIANVEYRVVIDKPGTLFLFVDNRVGNGVATTPPTLGEGVMDWAIAMGFTVSSFAINFSEPATAYALAVSGDPNTIVLGAQNDGSSRAMYTIAAAPLGWNFPPAISGVPATATVEPGDTLTVNAVVSDDGFPEDPGAVTVGWTVEDAPDGAIVSFDPDEFSADVVISFSDLGQYSLKFSAADGDKVTEKTLQVTVKIPEFAIECTNWVEASNDSNKTPSTHYKPTSYMYVRNHSAPRRRIQLISYDISALKEEGKAFANTYMSLRRRTGHSAAVLSVYGVREELDNFNLDLGNWNNLPGVQNTPTPPYSDQITLASLDLPDLSELLLEYGPNVPVGSAWSSTPSSAALDEFLNADDDGTVLLLFVTFTPEDADFEIFCKGYDTANSEPETGKTGIILRGNVMTQTWATNPAPAINSNNTTALTELSWTNPAGEGDITCNVYIGTTEPNVLAPNYGLTTLASGLAGNSVSLAGYPLTGGTTYYWVVDVLDSGTGLTTRGFVWSFNVLTNVAPTVQIANPIQYLWLGNDGDPDSATAVLDATTSDDGILEPLTYLWEQISAPEGVEVVIDPNDVEDKTLILPAAGSYVFRLSAFDGELTTTAAAQIFVGADPCQAAQAKPGYVQNPADFDDNCYVDINDFATFAAEWLDCNPSMDVTCPY